MADIDMPLAWRMMQDGYLMRINQLEAENAKLREENARLQEIVNNYRDLYRWEVLMGKRVEDRSCD